MKYSLKHTASNPLRVAVILFGQPRNVDSKVASRSLRYWLRHSQVDYYGHCWFSNENDVRYIGKKPDSTKILDLSIPINAPDLLRRQYPRLELVVEKPKFFEEEAQYITNILLSVKKLPHRHSDKLVPIFLSQFHSIAMALSQFNNKNNDFTYDYVILTRYDLFVSPFNRLDKLPRGKLIVSGLGHGFEDLLIVGTSAQIQSLNVYPSIKELVENGECICPEYLKKKSFLKNFSIDDIFVSRIHLNILRGTNILPQLFWLLHLGKRYVKIWIYSKAQKIKQSSLFS